MQVLIGEEENALESRSPASTPALVPTGSRGAPFPAHPEKDPPADGGLPGSVDCPVAPPPPKLPLRHAPGGPPGDRGGDDGETPQDTDQDQFPPRSPKPYRDPDCSGDDGGKDRRNRCQTSRPMTHQVGRAYSEVGTWAQSTLPEGEQNQKDMGADCRSTIEQSLGQIRHKFQGAIAQEFHGLGNRHEQLRQLVDNTVMNRLEDSQVRFARADELVSEVTRETDRPSREMYNSSWHSSKPHSAHAKTTKQRVCFSSNVRQE